MESIIFYLGAVGHKSRVTDQLELKGDSDPDRQQCLKPKNQQTKVDVMIPDHCVVALSRRTERFCKKLMDMGDH
jgi:hypothetical protein